MNHVPDRFLRRAGDQTYGPRWRGRKIQLCCAIKASIFRALLRYSSGMRMVAGNAELVVAPHHKHIPAPLSARRHGHKLPEVSHLLSVADMVKARALKHQYLPFRPSNNIEHRQSRLFKKGPPVKAFLNVALIARRRFGHTTKGVRRLHSRFLSFKFSGWRWPAVT